MKISKFKSESWGNVVIYKWREEKKPKKREKNEEQDWTTLFGFVWILRVILNFCFSTSGVEMVLSIYHSVVYCVTKVPKYILSGSSWKLIINLYELSRQFEEIELEIWKIELAFSSFYTHSKEKSLLRPWWRNAS